MRTTILKIVQRYNKNCIYASFEAVFSRNRIKFYDFREGTRLLCLYKRLVRFSKTGVSRRRKISFKLAYIPQDANVFSAGTHK